MYMHVTYGIQVNLYTSKKCKSKNLSGGMRRRLSVAMACIGNPDILILDEPTTGLDPASRRQVWDVIETVKDGRSVVSEWAFLGSVLLKRIDLFNGTFL